MTGDAGAAGCGFDTGRLDPELAEALTGFPVGDMRAGLSDPAVVGAMRSTAAILTMTGSSLPTHDGVEVADRTIAGGPGNHALRVRTYRPRATSGPLPTVVFFHGGAFIIGDPETEESRCLRYSAEAGCLVVSVDYRLAPEHPFPAAVDDCYAALEWTVAEAAGLDADPDRLAVGGSSAGGGLAAAVAQMTRDREGPSLRLQVLNYPVLDDTMTSGSMTLFDDTPVWTSGAAQEMWRQYLGAAEEPVSPWAAPARARTLEGLAPAYVMTCEFDPLRDEGLAYAQRLLLAGVATELHQFPGTFHGFDLIAPGSAVSRRAVSEQVDALRRGLAPG
jgi:acetyl esterase